MSFKKMKMVLVLSLLLIVVLNNVLMAAGGTCSNSCNGSHESIEKSFTLICGQLQILERINPIKNIEEGARAIQNILCELGRMKFSDAGQTFADLAEGYFSKTLANLGKSGDYKIQACFVSYPLAVHYFGKLYRTELKQCNPFKQSLWFHIERNIGFAKNSTKSSSDHQTTVEEFEKAKSQAYNLNSRSAYSVFSGSTPNAASISR